MSDVLPERDTIRRIREAVASGRIGKTFRAADVNAALKIEFAGVFLPKPRVGNPDGLSELFVQISRGLYRLKWSPASLAYPSANGP